jgi:tetratricopeptide (TPR) repeat protein
MEEFTHTLLENGSIQKKDHQYVLSRKASEIQVPDTIQGIIAARMDRLEENLKRTMQVASVIGRDFAYRILLTITGMQEELKTQLMNLQGLEFIYEKSLFPELEYMFKHTLTQEVAYNSLLVKRRKELHEKTGQAIEELYPDKLEEFYEALAYHYLAAENWEKAYQYLLSSALKAATRYSLWEAFRLAKEALNVLSKLPQTEANKRRGIDARETLTMVMMALGYPEDSLQILQEGERLSKELGDEKAQARFHGTIGMYHTMRQDAELGAKYLEEAFREAEKAQDVELMAPIGLQLCIHWLLFVNTERVAEAAPKVIALLESTHRESESFGWLGFNPYVGLVSSYGGALGWMGRFREAEVQCEKALRFATQMNHVSSIGYAECMYGWLFANKEDGQEAIEHSQKAIKYLEEAQVVTLVGFAWTNLGWGYYVLGETATGLKHAGKWLEICTGLEGATAMSINAYTNLANLYLSSGDLDNARSCAQKVMELGQKCHMEWHEMFAQTMLLGIAAVLDSSRFAEAEEYIVRFIKLGEEHSWRPTCAGGYFSLGWLAAAVGQREKAMKAWEKAAGMFEELGMGYSLITTQRALEGLKQ